MRRFLATKDELAVDEVVRNLPQSLVVVAEDGLDGEAVVDKIINDTQCSIDRLKLIDGKKNISVEQVRECIARLRTVANGRRLVIIEPAEALSEEAQGALLKTLEEPNKDTHFILLTHNELGLLSTIRSRCQSIVLHKTSLAQDREFLKSKNLSPIEFQQILFLAAGKPVLLNQLASDPTQFETYKTFATDAKLILANQDRYQTLKCLSRYFSDRQKAILLTDVMINIIKFQIKSGKNDLNTQLDNVIKVTQHLRQNGNVKLALLRLVV